MKNLVVLIALLLLCTVHVNASNVNISTASSATETTPKEGVGVAVGRHDAYLSEAPTLYDLNGGLIMRGGGVWSSKGSQVRLGFLSGVTDIGAHLNIVCGGTMVSRDLGLETGFKMGMNLDVWSDGSIVGVPHAKFQINSLLLSSTSVYTTVALGLTSNVPISQTGIRPPRLYSFFGISQEVGLFELDVAMGNHRTMRVGLAMDGIRVFGSETIIRPGIEFLRSPWSSSIAFFLTSKSF